MEIQNKKPQRYVNWQVFVWVIGIMTIAMGWCFMTQATTCKKVDQYNQQLLEIRTQLSQIQTDLSWIKNETR